MIRNASPFRTALLLFSLAASIAPSTARASYQNSAAEQAAAAQAAAEQAAAEAVAAFEACEARIDAALESRDVAAAEAALKALFPMRDRLDAARPGAGAAGRYRAKYDAIQIFKAKADSARKALAASVSGAEADGAEGSWQAVQAAIRRIDADLTDARTVLTAKELEAATARVAALRESLGAWQAEQAVREREVAEAAAIRGEIARADRLLARVAAEQDFDAADRRIDEVLAAIDDSEPRAKALALVPSGDLLSSMTDLRADAMRSREAVAANRASAAFKARVNKIVRDVNALPAGPESQPDMARLDAECDSVRKELEANKRVPSSASTELSDQLRSVRERIARMRGALDVEASKGRAVEFLAAAEQWHGEASEFLRTGGFDDADAALRSAADSVRQMSEALKAVPDAAWREQMDRRGSALKARLGRALKAAAAARASAALEAVLSAADANIASMSSESWPQDRARIAELAQAPDLPPAMRAKADAVVAKLGSFIAYNDAIEKWTRPIEAAIDAGDFGSARKQLASLRAALTTPPLSAYHREFLTRLGGDFEARIESGEFWRMAAIAGAAVGAVLLLVVVGIMLRRRSDGMAVELRTARQRRDQKVRQLKLDSERSPTESGRAEARERLANFERIDSSGFSAMVPGAAPASVEWQDASVLTNQLAALGDPDAARALVEAAARHRLTPGKPMLKGLSQVLGSLGVKVELFVPYFESSQVRLSNGARAVELAHAWTEIWRASPPVVRDLMARSADHWFGLAVEWLPGHEDVPVLFAQAEFKRDQGNPKGALSLLIGGPATAEQRIKDRPMSVAPTLKCKVFLLAANIKLDLAGVVSLHGQGGSPAVPWPVIDQYGANLHSPPSGPLANGEPSPTSLIADARELLQRADQSLGAAASAGAPATVGAAASASAGIGFTPPPSPPAGHESLRFQIGAAQFRAELGGGHQQAENALQRVLREPEPTAFGVLIGLSAQRPSAARLADDWSRLQPLMDSGALTANDCRVVRDMRLNWVNWCIERGKQFGIDRREVRLSFYRKAAWLASRYWLLVGNTSSFDQWESRKALVAMAGVILDVQQGPDGQRTLGGSAWNPEGDREPNDNDRGVFALLKTIVGAEVAPPPSPAPPPPVTNGGWTPPPPPPQPKLSNVWLVPGPQRRLERVGDKDVPVFDNLRIVDPAMSGADVTGAFAWIDVGGGEPARAMGVFGFELLEVYKEQLKTIQSPVSDLDGRGSAIIGSVNQLANLTFDGLPRLSDGFKIVLSHPAPAAFGDPTGSEMTSLPRGERLCAPIELDKTRIFAPAPDRQPPAPVSEEVIERSLYEISLFIAAIGVDAKPIAQTLATGTSTYGMAVQETPAAWMAIVKFFRTQLGGGLFEVKEEIKKRATQAAAAGLQSSQAPFADGVLDEQFIRSLVQQLCLRADALRYVDVALAWNRLDPALKAAMERLVRRFDERNPNILNKDSLKKHFGIDLGGMQPPPVVIKGGGTPASTPASTPALNPLRSEFEGIVRDLPHREVGDFWPFATSREALLGTLQDMIDNLQALSLGVSPERRAGIGALIDRIRALQGKLR